MNCSHISLSSPAEAERFSEFVGKSSSGTAIWPAKAPGVTAGALISGIKVLVFLVTLAGWAAVLETPRFLWLGSQRIFFFLQLSQALMIRMRCAWSRCSLVLDPRD